MSVELIGSRKMDYYIFNPNAVIFDLRTFDEYKISRIRNSYWYSYDNIIADFNENKWFKTFNNKNKIYVLYCNKGLASLEICEILADKGFVCKSLVGGFDAYRGNNLTQG